MESNAQPPCEREWNEFIKTANDSPETFTDLRPETGWTEAVGNNGLMEYTPHATVEAAAKHERILRGIAQAPMARRSDGLGAFRALFWVAFFAAVLWFIIYGAPHLAAWLQAYHPDWLARYHGA